MLTCYRVAPLKNSKQKFLSYKNHYMKISRFTYNLILLTIAGQYSYHPRQFPAVIDTLYTDLHIQSTHRFLLATKYSENAVIVGSFLCHLLFVPFLFLCLGYLDSYLVYYFHFYRSDSVSVPVPLSLNTEVSELP